jgi:hypothetical protein
MDTNDHVVGMAARPLSGPRHVHFTLADPGSPSFHLEDRLPFLDLSLAATSTPKKKKILHVDQFVLTIAAESALIQTFLGLEFSFASCYGK